MEEGRRELAEAEGLRPNTGLARNVVVVVGDGMSLTTVAGARILKGQRAHRDGASSRLAWEAFPHIGLSKTYNVNSMVPDSAATAFAMFSGVKTNFYTMGYDSSIVKGSLESMMTARPVETVLEWAQAAGMRTGVVTTARVTHATPAALYARTAHRDWECARAMPADRPPGALDITRQLVETARGRAIDVLLGGGLASFLPEGDGSVAGLSAYSPGWPWACRDGRADGRDLLAEWRRLHPRGRALHSRQELLNVDYNSTEQLLGLFSRSYLPYEDERAEHPETPRWPAPPRPGPPQPRRDDGGRPEAAAGPGRH
jgi:alkaline phosphatase